MQCEYCKSEGKMSREHIIPKGFINNMNFKEQTVWFDKAPSRVINNELMIKDVCANCNNGELSKLDAYALKLLISYNDKISFDTKKIYFKYNYHMLTRWLLKVCYNSARANDADFDIGLYQEYISYILNKDYTEALDISIFAMFMEVAFDKETQEECYHLNKDRNYEIDWFRIAPFRMVNLSVYYIAMRCIMINSLAFLVVVYNKDTISKKTTIEQEILKTYPNFVKLLTNNKACLKKDIKFWHSSYMTNYLLRDNFLGKRTSKMDGILKLVNISKKEVFDRDYNQLKYLKNSYMSTKDDLKDSYQSFELMMDGYNDDKRELYQIKEVQDYIIGMINKFPDIIWILNLELSFFQVILGAYINEKVINDKIDSSRQIDINQK
ncbi:hypothetical protein SAMN02745136_00940 [Anaerocolumna jejuensis DSM 15929]|uniref:HNH endonuclease n=1 Tax=Anaerocolumna jejuensis DSM 15929 TaxID=1121322 RepID=A0A1M6MBR8_9FIRM|nr:hypothetical protein SAMN02745136_00940 [Anaerocolumna jejuensis DSM 15929]